MNDDELIAAIRANSDLDDCDDVERAAYATLTVLGRSLAGARDGQRLSVIEFYGRVGQMEGTGREDARRHARAVMAGVKAAIDRYEWNNMLAQLPADYADLVGTGSAH